MFTGQIEDDSLAVDEAGTRNRQTRWGGEPIRQMRNRSLGGQPSNHSRTRWRTYRVHPVDAPK